MIEPRYRQLGDAAKPLYENGLPLHEIATRLNCNIAMLAKAMRWRACRDGTTLPDGRARRKTLDSTE